MPSRARGRRRSSNKKTRDEGKGRARRRVSKKRDEESSDESSYSSDYSGSSGSYNSGTSSRSSSRVRSDPSSEASSSRKSMSSASDVDTASESSKSDGSEVSGSRFSVNMKRSAIGKRAVSNQSQKNAANTSRLSMAASLALQRRKKESPQLKIALDNRRVREVDYHQNVSAIYTHIENQRWREVAERCRTNPIETKTWVYRMDKKKKSMLWRMLPIHTAILYRAPVYVLLDLIQAYPEGPTSPDDRRMLPIHMACRIVCKEDVLRLLLKHAPSSVFAEDAKGRTPRDFLAEAKRENKSKVLQKVNERNRKNLLKLLKQFEQMKDEPSDRSKSRSKAGRSRSSKQSVSGSRFGFDDHDEDDRRSTSRRSSRGDSSRADRRKKRRSDVGSSRGRYTDDEEMSRSSRRSKSSRVSRMPRSPRTDDDEMSRVSRRSRTSRVSRTPRSPRTDDDDEDDGEFSRSSRRSKTSKDMKSSPKKSLTSPLKSPRTPRLPPTQYAKRSPRKEEEFDEPDEHEISTIKFDKGNGRNSRPQTAESAITSSTTSSAISGSSTFSAKEVSAEVPNSKSEEDEVQEDENGSQEEDGVLDELWLELEENYPVPEEEIDESVKAENVRRVKRKKVAKQEAISNIKYFEPPKELKKLLDVINSTDADASFNLKKRPGTASSSRAPLMPGRENNASRRVNACGALKALSKNEKNRLRLGRTKGVISSLCNALRDPTATVEERFRCSNTLMFLSVPKKNWEAIFNSNEELIPTLTMCMGDEDHRVQYNACFCLFLLSKSEHNRYEIFSDGPLMNALVEVSDIEIARENNDDDQSIMSMDVDLGQEYQNLGSPSGIREQGAPATDDESKRGTRLSAMKAFLSLSKLQEGAHNMVQNHALLELLMRISGTMTTEENLLCMALIANFTRDQDNIPHLTQYSEPLIGVLKRGLNSRSVEVQKCASMSLQNLSCNKQFRVNFSSNENVEIMLSSLANIGTDVVVHNEANAKDPSKSKSLQTGATAEGQVSAIHAIKNLSLEPRNILPLTNTPGITAALMNFAIIEDGMEEKENIDEHIKYVASDALSTMSQWLSSVAVSCAEKNNVDLRGRSLNTLKVATWNQWE
jgi:hypothetical protein